MINFISYLEQRDVDFWFRHCEMISEMTMDEIALRKPKYSEWRGDFFYFDVEGDDCSPKWCYFVWFEQLPKSNSYEISFKRMNETKDERRGVGNQVMGAVQYAIMEFIKQRNPDQLIWSPVKTKTVNPVTGRITNPEGRKEVYEIFAIKSLFPLYVSVKANEWIRRDIYDRDYVSKGYPAIPVNMTTSSNSVEKKKLLQNIRSI